LLPKGRHDAIIQLVSAEFLLTSLVVVATPGTGVIYTLAAGLARGARASVIAAFGCTLGIVPHMAAAITGLAALLHTSAVAFSVLKYLGVAYLLYLAWSTLREKGTLAVNEEEAPASARRTILTAVLINLLNPKLTIFFFAFLPQFVGPGDPNGLLHMVALSLVFMAMTFVLFAVYGLLASGVREQVISRPRVLAWMRRAFAGSFVALGAKLALTRNS
jgi:threonine/homoserine/homoserine lactone efflux protein